MEIIKESKARIEELLRSLFDITIKYGLFGFEILIDKGIIVKFPDERTYNNNNRSCRVLFISKYWVKLKEYKSEREE